jgi:methylmalonyl-CoA mutase
MINKHVISAPKPSSEAFDIALRNNYAVVKYSLENYSAGYEVVDNLGFKTVEEGVAAAQAAGADIIVLCSSDDEYAELAPAAFKAIDGKQIFVVAGAPACTDDLKAIGIEHFINVKTNVLETLKQFNQLLSI